MACDLPFGLNADNASSNNSAQEIVRNFGAAI